MSTIGAAARAAVPKSSACAPLRTDVGGRSESQARASRRNGARSRGPKTPAGKARPARNAIKHGLRAGKFLVVPDEDAGEFDDFEKALLADLAPRSALQAVLARRIVSAPGGWSGSTAWRPRC